MTSLVFSHPLSVISDLFFDNKTKTAKIRLIITDLKGQPNDSKTFRGNTHKDFQNEVLLMTYSTMYVQYSVCVCVGGTVKVQCEGPRFFAGV